MKLCPNCHSKVERETARFCENCGKELIDVRYSPIEAAKASFFAGKYAECIGSLRKQMKQGSDEAKRLYSVYLDDSEAFRLAVEDYEYSKSVQSSSAASGKSGGPGSADPSIDPEYLFRKGEEELNNGSKEAAFKCFTKAAGLGHLKAQWKLGECYYKGWGVKQNHQEAVSWYRMAAEKGEAEAQCRLGFCYFRGRGIGKDEKEAIRWYSTAARKGNAEAQCKLGECYLNGQSVPRDVPEALKWYSMAAEQGNLEAQLFVADCYFLGREGVHKNVPEALKWYGLAAKQGDLKTQCKLGDCFFYGREVKRDIGEAVEWYRMAAKQGNLEAQLTVDAFNYLKVAGSQPNRPGQKPIDSLKKLMDEILDALK